MSRILLCVDGFFRSFSPLALEPYIQQFVHYLTENGNTVMPYILEDIKHKKPFKVATHKLRTIYEVKKFAFEKTGFDKFHFDVRKENKKVIRFHKMLGAKIVDENDIDYFFECTKEDYLEKIKEFVSGF